MNPLSPVNMLAPLLFTLSRSCLDASKTGMGLLHQARTRPTRRPGQLLSVGICFWKALLAVSVGADTSKRLTNRVSAYFESANRRAPFSLAHRVRHSYRT